MYIEQFTYIYNIDHMYELPIYVYIQTYILKIHINVDVFEHYSVNCIQLLHICVGEHSALQT